MKSNAWLRGLPAGLLAAVLLLADVRSADAQVPVPPVGPGAAPPAAVLRRFALVISANDGGSGRVRLRFADSDAKGVADVMQSLGGIARNDLVLVPSATRQSVAAAFAQVKQNLAQAASQRVRRELFVYYSGHSDEEGLLLAGERVAYRELRDLIDAAGADVRIAILDSCASGALIRRRGGTHGPGFLADLSTDARGHAFLTASSADEAAQESDRIGAAFFTHYLVSGLRGAADSNRNGRVTLDEAYQFAYQETLRRTERTAAGPQHAAYDFQLAGRGDFVVTDVRATGAALVLDENIAGRIYVRDSVGHLLVELRKEPLYPVELGLGPGEYQVSLDADGRPFEARVVLQNGRRARLSRKEFVAVGTTVALAKGDAPAAGTPPAFAADAHLSVGAVAYSGPYHDVGFELVLAPGVRTGGNDARPVRNKFVLGVLGHSHALQGFQLSIGGNIVEHNMLGTQLSIGFNQVRGSARGSQISAGANIVNGSMVGAQISDITNITLGNMRGAQLSLVNWTGGNLLGAQLGLVNHAAGTSRGAQIGLFGHTGGHFTGLQAGVLNVGRGFEGTQIGVGNFALDGRSVQMGVANMGGRLGGAQIGVVNMGRKVRGLQLGVVNLAESVDGASIGILNLIGDGYHAVSLWSSDLLASNIGVKLGSRHFYTLFGFGAGRGDQDKALYGGSFGLGFHSITFAERFFVDVDAVGTHFGGEGDWESNNQLMASMRATLGIQLFKYLAITVGPSYNLYMRKVDGADRTPGLGWFESSDKEGDYEFRRFPGFLLGLQI